MILSKTQVSTMNINLVIKFGGSCITVKEQFETLRLDALKTAATLIKTCVDQGVSCVVVHGAGSFGHHQAKQFKCNDGWNHSDDVEKVKRGLCLTRQSVTKLHQHVVAALLDEKIPAVGISCFCSWESNNRVVIKHDVIAVTSLLSQGFVPVLHGDCILDRTLGCVILSGDTIIQTICSECSIDRVVFLTSVDGVYDKPPSEHSDAELQREILINKDGQIVTKTESSKQEGIVSNSSSHDVTGGMTLKLRTAIEIVKNSAGRTPVYVCKIGSRSSVDICCKGTTDKEENMGTAITYQDT